ASLHRFRDLAEMAVTGVELAPGLGDPDDGSGQVLGGQPPAAGVRPADEEAELGIAVVRETAPDPVGRRADGGGWVAHGAGLLSARVAGRGRVGALSRGSHEERGGLQHPPAHRGGGGARSGDRVAVKPTAAPIFYAIQVLRGLLPPEGLQGYRSLGGLQAYPSRTKNPDWFDFSTGSMGLGAVAPAFATLVDRYVLDHFGGPG